MAQPAAPTDVDLTQWSEALNNGLADGTPCLVISSDKSGHPDVAFKGSVMVYDKDHLAYWERSLNEQIPQVEENPHIVVLYRNPAKYQIPHMRLYGDATVYKTGDEREKVMSRVVQRELDQDPERKGYAVVVKIDRVRVGRNTVQERKS